jgi:hypothetical protein
MPPSPDFPVPRVLVNPASRRSHGYGPRSDVHAFSTLAPLSTADLLARRCGFEDRNEVCRFAESSLPGMTPRPYVSFLPGRKAFSTGAIHVLRVVNPSS